MDVISGVSSPGTPDSGKGLASSGLRRSSSDDSLRTGDIAWRTA